MEQFRLVDTPHGPIPVLLRRRRVKNLNLRVGADGTVALSVPLRYPLDRAEDFLRDKSGWIARALERQRAGQARPLPPVDREECAARLEAALDRVWPLAAPLGIPKPALKPRALKSQWGNCHWAQGYITLNTALARCPEELRDYVALHELVHFLHHDHGPGFYARMDALMPDWRRRRGELKRYGAALEGAGPAGRERETSES